MLWINLLLYRCYNAFLERFVHWFWCFVLHWIKFDFFFTLNEFWFLFLYWMNIDFFFQLIDLFFFWSIMFDFFFEIILIFFVYRVNLTDLFYVFFSKIIKHASFCQKIIRCVFIFSKIIDRAFFFRKSLIARFFFLFKKIKNMIRREHCEKKLCAFYYINNEFWRFSSNKFIISCLLYITSKIFIMLFTIQFCDLSTIIHDRRKNSDDCVTTIKFWNFARLFYI